MNPKNKEKSVATVIFCDYSVENQDPSSFPDNIYERAQAHVYRLMEKVGIS